MQNDDEIIINSNVPKELLLQYEKEFKRRELVKNALSGLWEYECRVSNDCFDNGEIKRGGMMLISVTNTWAGLQADIKGYRYWAENNNGLYQLKNEVHWTTEGAVLYSNGDLIFTYTPNDENSSGTTKDTFFIDSNTFQLLDGSFTHYKENHFKINGIVKVNKMKDKNDFTKNWKDFDIKKID